MERPILFNTEMVRAILDGRKTQTRRIIKDSWLQSIDFSKLSNIMNSPPFLKDEKWYYELQTAVDDTGYYEMKMPCNIGDMLWVRETFARRTGVPKKWNEDVKKIGYKASPEMFKYEETWTTWKPSIHMPREAARIFLRVTDVKAERLQDITEEDAEKEGIGDLFIAEIANSKNSKYSLPMKRETLNIEQFELLWNSTIKKQDINDYGWDANPWVWVIEFERVEETEL